ncbi:unnamed protein product [Moneuplotes crassus]|uniref:Uncharacterized protein n=1 Tax=Euplotes crassus TaxID=5936 RepID=A0AAD1U3E2_EUPCR|nr:unnamed protein product [Moneuplotes crassus]
MTLCCRRVSFEILRKLRECVEGEIYKNADYRWCRNKNIFCIDKE